MIRIGTAPHNHKHGEENWWTSTGCLKSQYSPYPKVFNCEAYRREQKDFHAGSMRYQSGIDMLLYLVEHSWPDLVTAAKELSKANDNAKPAAYKELICVIRYVIDTKNLGLNI